MKFSIINIKELSGDKALVYSVKYENKEVSELQNFLYKFQDTHQDLLHNIFQRIHLISKRNGVQSSFFKRESPESHNVYRLLKTKELRVYCIMFDNIVLLFGSGGIKKSGTKKLNENPSLEAEVERLMKIEDVVRFQIKRGFIGLTKNGFEGELNNLEY